MFNESVDLYRMMIPLTVLLLIVFDEALTPFSHTERLVPCGGEFESRVCPYLSVSYAQEAKKRRQI